MKKLKITTAALKKLQYSSAAIASLGCMFKFLDYPGGELLFALGTGSLTVYFTACYFKK
jgi:hypothetical protein